MPRRPRSRRRRVQVRKLEDLLYELSLTGAHDGQKSGAGAGAGAALWFVAEDFARMAAAMDAYDKQREEVRDTTTAASAPAQRTSLRRVGSRALTLEERRLGVSHSEEVDSQHRLARTRSRHLPTPAERRR